MHGFNFNFAMFFKQKALKIYCKNVVKNIVSEINFVLPVQ